MQLPFQWYLQLLLTLFKTLLFVLHGILGFVKRRCKMNTWSLSLKTNILWNWDVSLHYCYSKIESIVSNRQLNLQKIYNIGNILRLQLVTEWYFHLLWKMTNVSPMLYCGLISNNFLVPLNIMLVIVWRGISILVGIHWHVYVHSWEGLR